MSDAGDFTNSTGQEYIIGTTKTNPLILLKNDGNVGIGTTTPSYKLDVSGSGNFTDRLTVTGSISASGDLAIQGFPSVSASLALAGLPADTGSLMTTGSVSSNTLTFTKGDGTTFDLVVDTGSSGGGGGGSQTLQQVLDTGNTSTTGMTLNGELDVNGIIFTTSSNVQSLGIGNSVLSNNTGVDVTAIGRIAGQNNSGSNCVMIGESAGLNNSGSSTVMIGELAGSSNKGDDCVLIGYTAGQSNFGNQQVFIGFNAGKNQFSGSVSGVEDVNNVSIGFKAGEFSSGSNVLIGALTGKDNQGTNNAFIGAGNAAGEHNTGDGNIGIGANPLDSNQGDHNIAFGRDALKVNERDYSVAIGHSTLKNQTTGQYNIAIGRIAGNNGAAALTGQQNIFIGYDVTYGNSSGGIIGAIGIGNSIDLTQSYSVVLGRPTYTYMKVGIGTTTPTARLHVKSGFTTSAQMAFLVEDSNGTDLFKVTSDGRVGIPISVTPSGTSDSQGSQGDISYDDDYFYVKTSAGWKRAALSTF